MKLSIGQHDAKAQVLSNLLMNKSFIKWLKFLRHGEINKRYRENLAKSQTEREIPFWKRTESMFRQLKNWNFYQGGSLSETKNKGFQFKRKESRSFLLNGARRQVFGRTEKDEENEGEEKIGIYFGLVKAE